MNNNARYDRSTNFLELEVNVARTIGILRDVPKFSNQLPPPPLRARGSRARNGTFNYNSIDCLRLIFHVTAILFITSMFCALVLYCTACQGTNLCFISRSPCPDFRRQIHLSGEHGDRNHLSIAL